MMVLIGLAILPCFYFVQLLGFCAIYFSKSLITKSIAFVTVVQEVDHDDVLELARACGYEYIKLAKKNNSDAAAILYLKKWDMSDTISQISYDIVYLFPAYPHHKVAYIFWFFWCFFVK